MGLLQYFCFIQGCYELVTSFIERNLGIIAGVTFGIAFSQVSALLQPRYDSTPPTGQPRYDALQAGLSITVCLH